ncbi:MAG: hypothetical protein FE78DRAFT_418955 [Acidomyces sp. 'richmondensis']|nr:MAG: hypothetical protein FE78DRAFT_418955 [Acidomyces sp. 'richmondensis']
MRLEHNHEHRPRPPTNGSSSQNGSSPHTVNGSVKNGTEANGFHTNGHGLEGARAQITEPFFGHNREEVTRILLQSLSDLGYHEAARQLADDSGYELELPSVAAFRNAVLHGDWDDAELLLFGSESGDFEGGVPLGNRYSVSRSWQSGGESVSSQKEAAKRGLPLAEGADVTLLKFLLRQQKYLELLEAGDKSSALAVLRMELTPLKQDIGRLHEISSLMMCPSPDDLRRQAEWDGADGQSRTLLLSEISKSISPSVMIPEHRLATLFTAVQEEQIISCRYHNTTEQPSLYTDHECSAEDFPLHTLIQLRNHSDEVWHVEFSHDGTMLATAGKDGLVCVYDTHSWRCRFESREHERNAAGPDISKGVCYIAFSPDDQYLISCSQNNEFVVLHTRDGKRVAYANHFDYPVTTAAWLPDSQTFVVGTQSSQRPLGLYSLRNPNASSSSSVEIFSFRDPPGDQNQKDNANSFRITDCTVSPDGAQMAATTIDNRIMMYDLRTRSKIAEWEMEDKLTSINFGVDGTQLLVNMNDGKVLALNALTGSVIMQYVGIKQAEFVIRSAFGGANENFVISGSEDSRIYIWRRQTGMQVACLEAHAPGTVNAVAWHPIDHDVFASAGDDRKVRIWTSETALRIPPVDSGASRSF